MSQTFRECLVAELRSITELTAIVGTNIFPGFLPQTFDLAAGSALTYQIPSNPKGHVLTGSDGTSIARVTFEAQSYTCTIADAIIEALRNGIDGTPDEWGDGSLVIMSVVEQDDDDEFQKADAGTDQPNFQRSTEYAIKYRVTIPTLT